VARRPAAAPGPGRRWREYSQGPEPGPRRGFRSGLSPRCDGRADADRLRRHRDTISGAEENTMDKSTPKPLRGHAAWLAAKDHVAKQNAAAHARGRKERAARAAELAGERRAAELKERADLPGQPRPH
jgi:hypothetical protein